MEFRGEDISWFLSTPEEFGGWGGVKLRIDRDINKFVYTLNKKKQTPFENSNNSQSIK